MADFVEGDTGSAIQFTCVDSITVDPIDLTDYTVTISWKTNKVLHTQYMQIIDATAGLVRYKFAANELKANSMSFDITLTNTINNQILTCKDVVRIDVRPRV